MPARACADRTTRTTRTTCRRRFRRHSATNLPRRRRAAPRADWAGRAVAEAANEIVEIAGGERLPMGQVQESYKLTRRLRDAGIDQLLGARDSSELLERAQAAGVVELADGAPRVAGRGPAIDGSFARQRRKHAESRARCRQNLADGRRVSTEGRQQARIVADDQTKRSAGRQSRPN